MKTIRARLGEFTFDAYNPSNIEVLFEFLNTFHEVVLPGGQTYRINNGNLEIFTDQWNLCELTVNDLLAIVKDMTSDDWLEVRKNSKIDNILNITRLLGRP